MAITPISAFGNFAKRDNRIIKFNMNMSAFSRQQEAIMRSSQATTSLPTQFIHEEAFDHLAKGDSIAVALLDQRNEAMVLVEEVLERLTKLNNLMERYCPINGKDYELLADDLFRSVSSYTDSFHKYKDSVRKRIDGKYWRKLLEASRCTTLMNTAEKDEMEKRSSTDAPPFEFNPVISTLQSHYENRMTTFVEAGVDLFKSLDQSYKSNDRICLRKKVIFDGQLYSNGWNSYGSGRNRIHDIERIFMILDGKDPALLKPAETAPYELERVKRSGETEFEHDYFTAKMYQNGNIHLIFTRLDLIDKFNDMLASYHGTNLGYRSAKY